MPTPTFQPLQGTPDPAQIQDFIVKLIRDLNYMLGNLDTLNVNRLDAKVIIAHTITALQIAAGTITANEIMANTITANKMSVTQLSAIAADLGTIIAGNIYGTHIATANGTYPRIELSNTANLLQALTSATNYVKIDADLSMPSLVFNNGVISAAMFLLSAFGSTFGIVVNGGDLQLQASAGHITAQSVAGTITDIVAAINSKQNSFSGFTGSQSVITSVNFAGSTTTSKTLNFSNGILTSIT